MVSLHAVLLQLHALNEATISPTQGHHCQALLLKLLSSSDSKLTEWLHTASDLRPYTASSLMGKFRKTGMSHTINQGNSYLVRYTFLNTDIFTAFLDSVLKEHEKVQRLENASFQIGRVIMDSAENPLCGHTTFQRLFEDASSGREITLRFLSPTVFRSGGKRNIIIPNAILVFKSYLMHWQKFSNMSMKSDLEGVMHNLRISRYHLQTKILHFPDYREIGFVGDCVFELPRNISDEEAGCLNALADFAFYCGTGAKTAMGMGQTRRIK